MARIMEKEPIREALVMLAVLALLGVIFALDARAAYGTSFTVTKTADTADGSCDTDCSLREAIIAANAASGNDVITVPAGHYTLTIPGTNEDASATGDLDITSPTSGIQNDLTIRGSGSTVIDGGGIDRVLHLSLDDDTGGPAVRISNLTVTGGSTAGATFSNDGGGIEVERSSALTLTKVVVADNAANFAQNSGSSGGGIANYGSLTLEKSTVRANRSLTDGGGIYNRGPLEVFGSTINGNRSGGPDPSFSGAGGGIANLATTATVTNSTISGNTTDDGGGGFYNDGVLTLTNATIAFNRTSGIYSGARPENSLEIKNTIVAKNRTPTGATNNCDGSGITSRGHNLESGTDCGFTALGDLRNKDPLLGVLGNNGGPTKTHALLTGSPAINAAAKVGCPATDQRGITRPQGPRCDIGAFEKRM